MENILARCAGLDVYKETVEAHLRRIEPDGPLRQETRTWGMSTREIVALADWMAAQGAAHVAIISTGVYWNRSTASWEAASRCCWSMPRI